jgi:hypothetical protein
MKDYPEIKMQQKRFRLLASAVPHEKRVQESNICRQSNDYCLFFFLPSSCDFNILWPIKKELVGRRIAAICTRFVLPAPTELYEKFIQYLMSMTHSDASLGVYGQVAWLYNLISVCHLSAGFHCTTINS